MVSLTSKSSSQIKFPGNPSISRLEGAQTVTVETGVAVFALTGTHAHDWTRDTLVFPVGAPCTVTEFAGGIAAASPTSYWTPMNNLQVVGGGTEPGGDDSAGLPTTIYLPGSVVPPPIGVAIDSATVSYSAQEGQPIITMALAVFGNNCALLRASYTAFVVNTRGGVIVAGGIGGGVAEAKAKE
jgi:hypothetical protein